MILALSSTLSNHNSVMLHNPPSNSINFYPCFFKCLDFSLLNIIKGFIQCFQQQFHLRIFIISKSVWNECLYVKEGHVHNRTRPSFIISLTSVLIIWTGLHRMQRPCPSLRSGHSTPEQLEAYRLNPGPSTQTSLRCLLQKQSS